MTTLDDYPLHQTPLPFAVPATSDPNAYDRFWFDGFVEDGSLYFSVAAVFYPNRCVRDGGTGVVIDGYQHWLHSSGETPPDPQAARRNQRRRRGVISDPDSPS